MNAAELLWSLHFAAVAFMTGLIWLIQIVHYPLMSEVDSSRFQSFHAAHSIRITWIVGPVMGLELVTAAMLPVVFSPGFRALACLGLTLSVFGFTAFLSVPLHARLAQAFDIAFHRRLVLTNWPRTVAWSLHLLICLVGTPLA